MEAKKIAERVRAGEPGAMLELWEAVRRFVEVKAKDCAHRCRVPLDDLRQDGFLAVLDAVELYDTERERVSFMALLSLTLRKRFSEEVGVRSSKRDALRYADSIDGPVFPNEPDGPTVGESLADDGAALAFSGVEYADFLHYCRRMIGAALDTLTDAQAAILRLHYLEGLSLEAAAPLCGLSSKQTASETEQRALSHLERGRYRRELRECLTAFDDFRAYGEAAQRDTWSRTGISRTEAAAIVKAGGMRE